MAAAAAEFVALERDRAAAHDAGEIERLAQPRLEAQESLSRTMSQMQSMLKERDAMRMRAMGIEPDPEPAAYTPSVQPPARAGVARGARVHRAAAAQAVRAAHTAAVAHAPAVSVVDAAGARLRARV